MSTHDEYLTIFAAAVADEDAYQCRKYWVEMTFGPNLLTGTKWTGATWMAAHPEHEGWVTGSWTEHRPTHLITTCCYGNCEQWSHGNTATHRWFTPLGGIPFVALCKGHAKQRRDEGEDVVAYTTLVRRKGVAIGKEVDAEKASRAAWWDRGYLTHKVLDRYEDRLHLWWQRRLVREGRAYGLIGPAFDSI